MAVGITVHLERGQTVEFPDADAAERMVNQQNHWSLAVGSLVVLRGRELQKVFKKAEWRWYERHATVEPRPPKRVMVPRRNGTITAVPGNRWQMVEGISDKRGPYHSWVIYGDQQIRAVFRNTEVELNGEPWLE